MTDTSVGIAHTLRYVDDETLHLRSLTTKGGSLDGHVNAGGLDMFVMRLGRIEDVLTFRRVCLPMKRWGTSRVQKPRDSAAVKDLLAISLGEKARGV